MQKLYFRFKGTENIHAFMCRNEHERGTIVSLSGCDLELTYRPKGNERPGCAGMIIEENESEFWAVGYNTDIRLLPKKVVMTVLPLYVSRKVFLIMENGVLDVC